jgi:hypothetical protein
MPRRRHRLIGISIDFDYFVPEDNAMDMQHAESVFYQTIIWEIRCGHLYPHMRTSGEERDFWKKLEPLTREFSRRISVSDSHVYILSDERFKQCCDTIILFDRHPDCWHPYADDRRNHVWYCHTWVRGWLEGDKNRHVIWVYPDYMDAADYADACKGVRRLRSLPRKEFDPAEFTSSELSAVHVCRSGCWTPPWTDQAFVEFIGEFGRDVHVLQIEKPWNPMAPRWTEEETVEKVARMRETEKKVRELHQTHCIGGDPLVPL